MSAETSIVSSDDVRKRVAAAAAATAARRKRRKALARNRSLSPHRSRLARAISLISPTVTGVQEVARRWRLGHTIAIPTECTYEVATRLVLAESEEEQCQDVVERRLQGVANGRGEAGSQCPAPHIYINSLLSPSPAISFLNQQFPERKYAFRKDGKVVSLHCFSETMQVLKRIAAKVWPGPVIVYVAVGGNNSTSCSLSPSRTTTNSDIGNAGTTEPTLSPFPTPSSPLASHPVAVASWLTTRRSSSSFLALRCPGHPLAVKVSLEFYKNSSDLLVGLALHHKPPQGRRQQQDDDDDDDVDDDDDDDDNCNNINNNCSCCNRNKRDSSSSYVTCANEIQSGPMAVLHGEEKLESFCVPTCEYRQPYGVTVWIEEGRRRVTLRGRHSHHHHHHQHNHHHHAPYHHYHLTSHHHVQTHHHHHHTPNHHPVTLTSILRALHHVKPKTEKDRVIQAVLNKWVVDEDSSSSVT